MKDLADHAVEIGQSEGATYVDARMIDSRDESVVARNGMILSLQDKMRSGIGIRVIADWWYGFGSTETLTQDCIGSSNSIPRQKKPELANVGIRFQLSMNLLLIQHG